MIYNIYYTLYIYIYTPLTSLIAHYNAILCSCRDWHLWTICTSSCGLSVNHATASHGNAAVKRLGVN